MHLLEALWIPIVVGFAVAFVGLYLAERERKSLTQEEVNQADLVFKQRRA
ncbi:MAG: hypothetical protein HY269_05635 [Deltaproteobacteria bacterium]|nr:hypothetical protein [Deltaproteobacteria bacterium]